MIAEKMEKPFPKTAEEWNDYLRQMLTEQKATYEGHLSQLRTEVEMLRHAETIETLRDSGVAGVVCPACFTRLHCHCESCFEHNKDKTPYLWKPDGMNQYCSVCGFTAWGEIFDDIGYYRMKFVQERMQRLEDIDDNQ